MSKRRRSVPKQASLVISTEGSVSASFLWDDVVGIATPAIEPGDTAASVAFPLEAYRECRACPRRCGFDRVARAHRKCGDFELRVGSFGLAHGDEPEISGTRGSGAIMLSGCPMRCPSCHSLEMVEYGTAVSIAEFLTLCRELQSMGAHNVQVLSPTVHLPALVVALAELKRSGFSLPIVMKSSGYETLDFVRAFSGLVDVWLPDFKYGPGSPWAIKAGTPDYFGVAIAAIGEMIKQAGPLEINSAGVATRGVLVRHVAAPIAREEREAIDRWFATLPRNVRVSIREEFQVLDEFTRKQVVQRA